MADFVPQTAGEGGVEAQNTTPVIFHIHDGVDSPKIPYSILKVTTADRDLMISPKQGLLIYNTTTNKLNFYTGSAWEAITSA